MLIVVALVLLATLLYFNVRKPEGFPPGPPRYPFIGYPFLEKHLVHKHMWRLSDTYGPVVGIYFGPQRTVIVNGWEAVKEALANEDLNGRPDNVFIRYRDGGEVKGVMFTEGELWKEQRRFSLHNFRNLGFGKRSHEAVIHEEVEELIKEIEGTDKGVSLQVKLGVSATNILWALMGGVRFQRNDPRLIDLVESLNKSFRAGEVAGSIVDIIPAIRHILPKDANYSVVMEGMNKATAFIAESVEEHKATLDTSSPRDFIDMFLTEMQRQKGDKETTFNEKQLVALCSDIFSAGSETGSSSVSFAILFCALHPDVMNRIHEELDSVVGRDRLPSLDDRPQLVYTEAVLTEMLRLRGAAPLTVPHCTMRDTKLQGYNIPARTMVMVNLYSIQMDRQYWGDPENFRPERFLNPDGTLRKDERMIPFGKGRRVCLGESLARMSLFLLFTGLMQKFFFTIDPSVHFPDTEGKGGFTLGPPDFKVFAKSRF
ncbi:methyl farnesoate epoxidase-like [Macrobrachium nipponense]|uniref:methyl farnesoate epoxidase-like n=1 Tax=Macrobrachium nipponense TaxID=159736 RepID=UPI0030C8503F